MKTLFKIALLSAFILYLPAQSNAWGLIGHRVVGEVAEQHISSKTKKKIKKILGHETIAMSSTWMDFIKSNPHYRYMNNWHFVNLPGGLNYEQAKAALEQDTIANAFNKIRFVTAELKKKDLPMEEKQLYLRILIHLVGDIHQPMHCGRAADKGGNDIKVKWFNRPDNLHSIWDSNIIEYQQLSYTEYTNAVNSAKSQEIRKWQSDDLTTWVYESYQKSEELYKAAEESTDYSYRYNYDWIDTTNQQLVKGGVRLAGLLNEIFGS
ncbi:S1/P1 nuclease [Arcticibacter pallidicorallinus]|uniref:S1/P1 nuclease n=1 Tax=Arcticibacter pallidicorallinus TaxID=1259464 RepID=A0A2T0U7P2_9SPHI|nr:S1/P1 nuclease [Arcticibacter pallidicorallinus]PRY53935.1 S1/P1 nuclease [Arcticibacter pallidicorallinus]